jgi:hypothetical protein
MNISKFDDLLLAANQQEHAQRLLLVFTTAELPDDPTPELRAGFEQGTGGVLVPLMCVHKTPKEVESFEQLALDAKEFARPWTILFASSVSGQGTEPPTATTADQLLNVAVEYIRKGDFSRLLAFDVTGQAVAMKPRHAEPKPSH